MSKMCSRWLKIALPHLFAHAAHNNIQDESLL
jgi:hypothetical protein